MQGGTLEQSKASLHNILPVVPTLLPTLDQPNPSAASASACFSEAPYIDSFTELEDKSKNMAPIEELLLCIGTGFVADKEQVLNPTQALGQYIRICQKKNEYR